ncbi:uncharacterized protein ISCGN_017638 [Ixodes scapularis]
MQSTWSSLSSSSSFSSLFFSATWKKRNHQARQTFPLLCLATVGIVAHLRFAYLFSNMLKEKALQTGRCKKWIAEFGDVFTTDGSVLSKVCEPSVSSGKQCHVTRHIATKKHVASAKRKLGTPQLLAEAFGTRSDGKASQFSKDLCKAFLSAVISLWKLTHDGLRTFSENTEQCVSDA